MRFSILTILGLVTLMAIAVDWTIALRTPSLDGYDWNESILPYRPADEIPSGANTKSGPIRFYMPFGATGSRKYNHSFELFVSQHFCGWNSACLQFVETQTGPNELQSIPRLDALSNGNRWASESHDWFKMGFDDAKRNLIDLAENHPQNELKKLIQKPTPWYHRIGRPAFFTVLFAFVVALRFINGRTAR